MSGQRSESQDRLRRECDEAIERLDITFPQGWRSGDRYCDGLTVLMTVHADRLSRSLFGSTVEQSS